MTKMPLDQPWRCSGAQWEQPMDLGNILLNKNSCITLVSVNALVLNRRVDDRFCATVIKTMLTTNGSGSRQSLTGPRRSLCTHAHTTVMNSFLAFKIMIQCRYTYVSSFAAVIKNNKILEKPKKNQDIWNFPRFLHTYQQLTNLSSWEYKNKRGVNILYWKFKTLNYDKKEARW